MIKKLITRLTRLKKLIA